jgi:hypothetical protein
MGAPGRFLATCRGKGNGDGSHWIEGRRQIIVAAFVDGNHRCRAAEEGKTGVYTFIPDRARAKSNPLGNR